MPDLLWAQVEDWFNPDPCLNGSAPDIWVREVSADDWQAVLDLIRSKGWAYGYTEDGQARRLPAASEMITRNSRAGVGLWVTPAPGFTVDFYPHTADEISCDVSLHELQGQDRLDQLCVFLRAVGRRLRKPVVMTPEGDRDLDLLGYQVGTDRVIMLAGPYHEPDPLAVQFLTAW